MSVIHEFNARANDSTDREHQVQLDLLKKLYLAVDAGASGQAVNARLAELIDYSEAHFVSEELLMRMKSYDDYQVHQADHDHMLEVLRNMAMPNSAEVSALLASKALEVLGFITKHIATQDKRLSDFVRTGQ